MTYYTNMVAWQKLEMWSLNNNSRKVTQTDCLHWSFPSVIMALTDNISPQITTQTMRQGIAVVTVASQQKCRLSRSGAFSFKNQSKNTS